MRKLLYLIPLIASMNASAYDAVFMLIDPACQTQTAIDQVTALNYRISDFIVEDGLGIMPKSSTRLAQIANLKALHAAKSPLFEGARIALNNDIQADLSSAACAGEPTFNADEFSKLTGYFPHGRDADFRRSINFPSGFSNDGQFHTSNPVVMDSEMQNHDVSSIFDPSLTGMVLNPNYGVNAFLEDIKPSTTPINMDSAGMSYAHNTGMAMAQQQLTGINIISDGNTNLASRIVDSVNNALDNHGHLLPVDRNGNKYIVQNKSEWNPYWHEDLFRYFKEKLVDDGKLLPVQSIPNLDPNSPVGDQEAELVNDKDDSRTLRVGFVNESLIPFLPDTQGSVCAPPGAEIAVDFVVGFAAPGDYELPYIQKDPRSSSVASALVSGATAVLQKIFPDVTNREMMDYTIDAIKAKSGRTVKDRCTGWGKYDFMAVYNWIKSHEDFRCGSRSARVQNWMFTRTMATPQERCDTLAPNLIPTFEWHQGNKRLYCRNSSGISAGTFDLESVQYDYTNPAIPDVKNPTEACQISYPNAIGVDNGAGNINCITANNGHVADIPYSSATPHTTGNVPVCPTFENTGGLVIQEYTTDYDYFPDARNAAFGTSCSINVHGLHIRPSVESCGGAACSNCNVGTNTQIVPVWRSLLPIPYWGPTGLATEYRWAPTPSGDLILP